LGFFGQFISKKGAETIDLNVEGMQMCPRWNRFDDNGYYLLVVTF